MGVRRGAGLPLWAKWASGKEPQPQRKASCLRHWLANLSRHSLASGSPSAQPESWISGSSLPLLACAWCAVDVGRTSGCVTPLGQVHATQVQENEVLGLPRVQLDSEVWRHLGAPAGQQREAFSDHLWASSIWDRVKSGG